MRRRLCSTRCFLPVVLCVVAVGFWTAATNQADADRDKPQSKSNAAAPPVVRLRATLTGHRGSITALNFSPDGRLLATGGENKRAYLWEMPTGQLKASLPGGQYVGDMTFSPDGRLLATWSFEKTIRLWETQSGRLKAALVVKKGMVSSVAFSPDARTVATASLNEHSIRLWDAETGQPQAILNRENECDYGGYVSIGDVVFSPDGRTLIASGDYNICLWDTASWQMVKASLPDPHLKTQQTKIIKHGKWEDQQRTFSHNDTIYRMILSPDGRTLATGSRDFTAKLWDAATWQFKQRMQHSGRVITLAFSRDGRTLATGSDDTTAKLWDVETGKLKAILEHRGTVWSIDFSPDGKLLATSADNDHAVKLWDAQSGKMLDSMSEARYPVAFSPDGQTLATGGKKGTVLLWDVSPR